MCVTEVSVVKHVCHRDQCCQAKHVCCRDQCCQTCVSQRSVLSSIKRSVPCVLQGSEGHTVGGWGEGGRLYPQPPPPEVGLCVSADAPRV